MKRIVLILLLLLCVASSAQAQLAPVQMVGAQSSGAVSSITTSGITTTTGNLIVVAVFADTNKIGTVTDNKSNTWSTAIAQFGSATYAALFYAENCTCGSSHTFTFTPTSSEFVSMFVLEVSGAATSSVLGSTSTSTTNTATHSSGSISANGTVPEIFVGLANLGNNLAVVPTNVTSLYWSWNHHTITASREGGIIGYRIVDPSTSGAFTTSSNGTSVASPIGIAGFKAASPAASGSEHSYPF